MTRKQKRQLEELGYVKRWGDRKDGRRLRDIDAMHGYMPFLMPNRCDAEVYQEEEMDVTNLLRYIARCNEENPDGHLTLFHCCVTAIAKTVKNRPQMNYFVSGQHMFERDKLTIGFVAKRRFEDRSEESLMVLDCKDDLTLPVISQKIVGDVKEARRGRDNTADNAMGILLKLPRCLVKAFVWWQRWSDYHRWYPESLMKVDTNFVSILMSNLGSIDCNACYHHLNNMGTNSVVVTIGVLHKKPVFLPDGSWELHDFANFAFTLDERIADGFYFARSIRLFNHILQNPELLERPLSEEVKYEFHR